MSDEEEQSHTLATQAIAIRPPPFSTNRVPSWFVVLEAQFTNSNITSSEARFRHVIANLPLEVCEKLTDTDLTSGDYDDIKSKVIALYSRSEPQIFNELLTIPSTLNTKPSIYLQQLRASTAAWNLPNGFLKMYFLNAMPHNIRPNLVTQTCSLDDLAKLADNLLDYNYHQTPSQYPSPMSFNPVANVNSAQQRNYNSRHYQQPTYNNSNNRSYNTSSYDNRSNKPESQLSSPTVPIGVRAFNPQQRPRICRFHLYYGNNAKRCKPWCILNNPSHNTMPDSRHGSRSSSPSRQQSEN